MAAPPRQKSPDLWFARVVALIIWATLAGQLVLSIQIAQGNGRTMGWGVVMYFGYFTIITNILAALVVTCLATPAGSQARCIFRKPSLATGVVGAMLLVGLAYHFLLRKTWNPEGLERVTDTLLHYVNPVLYLACWIWFIPKELVRWSAIPKWCLYPVCYSVYAFVRGALIGVYPYPFIDVNTLGLNQSVMNASLVLVAYVVISICLVSATHLPLPQREIS